MNILLVMYIFNIAHIPAKSLDGAFPYKCYDVKKPGHFWPGGTHSRRPSRATPVGLSVAELFNEIDHLGFLAWLRA